MSTTAIDCDYDQNSLAEKYIRMKYGDISIDDNKPNPFATMDAENIIRFIQQGLTYLDDKLTLPLDCALDIGCGHGNLSRVLLKEKLVQSTVGVDRSTHMIEYARLNTIPNANETYFVLNAVTDDLLTILGRKFPIIIQAYMLSDAENVQELTQIVSNIGRVCSGIFVGIGPNPKCDLTSVGVRKLKKYGIISKQSDCDEEVNIPMSIDGTISRPTFNLGTENELTLVDHWYSSETYEKVFRNAGFKQFEWMPLQWNNNVEQEEWMIDLIKSNCIIGFIAIM